MACSLRNGVFKITALTIHVWNNKIIKLYYKIYAGCVKLCPQ